MTDWINKVADGWRDLARALPEQAAHDRASVALHGSLARGVTDQNADIDLFYLLPREDFDALLAARDRTFYEVELDGREGHICIECMNRHEEGVRTCDLPLIYEWRHGQVLQDPSGRATALIQIARQAMPRCVSKGFFFYHYVMMRQAHRSSDNPMERGHAAAVLMGVTETIRHALMAAMVLDGEPYPYAKWLYQAARNVPSGRIVADGVDRILRLIGDGGLRLQGPERANPISTELRGIRASLRGAAETRGINEPWLERWWRYIDRARTATQGLKWPEDGK